MKSQNPDFISLLRDYFPAAKLASFKKYFKFLFVGVVVSIILSLLVLVMLIIGLFNLVVMPALRGDLSLPQPPQNILDQGQAWWEQRFNQEQQQLNDIENQLDNLRQELEKSSPSRQN